MDPLPFFHIESYDKEALQYVVIKKCKEFVKHIKRYNMLRLTVFYVFLYNIEFFMERGVTTGALIPIVNILCIFYPFLNIFFFLNY